MIKTNLYNLPFALDQENESVFYWAKERSGCKCDWELEVLASENKKKLDTRKYLHPKLWLDMQKVVRDREKSSKLRLTFP